MLRLFSPHARQFCLYILAGGTAFVVDFGSYLLLLQFDVWFVAASVVSTSLGFITAFLGHKYVVFRREKDFFRHLTKYFITEVANALIAIAVLYGLVQYAGVGKEESKLISMAMVVCWNFFVYKFIVYV